MSMLTKAVGPKTKAELIRALQAASFRSVDVFEDIQLRDLPSIDRLRKGEKVVIVLHH